MVNPILDLIMLEPKDFNVECEVLARQARGHSVSS